MNRWDRITELFERARDLPPEARGPFLEQHCAGDAALRAEVESLVDACEPARTFFEALEADVVGPTVGGLLDARAPFATGTRMGAYEIEMPIGAGGMGVVYRARDRRLNRTVALKFIASELTDDEGARERLVREARAAAALDDPRIGAIHAIEEAPDGRLFLVMQYYAGETLKQRLAAGALDAPQAVTIAAEVAEGLARAHRAGIVHRDIKPANVLITDEGAVKILDFGVAKLVSGAGSTRPGTTVGTAAYMAPEQARGEPADPRSDVWSLGVVLYEMLAGFRPFLGESEAAVIHAVLEGSPAPLRTHAPDVPAPLERLVERMLSRDPLMRPADAGAVADALREVGAGRPAGGEGRTGTRRPAAPRHRSRFVWTASRARGHARALLGGRRRRVALATSFVAVVTAAVFVASRRAMAPPRASTAVTVLPFVVEGDPELTYLRDGMVHLLSTKLDGIGDLRAVDPHALLASFGSEKGAPDPAAGRAAAGRFGAQAFVLGTVLRLGSGIQLSASLYRSDGTLQTTATAVAAQDANLSNAVDELVRELIAHRLTGARTRLAGLAAMTTHSLPALRAYLDGEHLLRTGRPAAALSALRTAVTFDSAFGLAWYRLARAAGWIGPTSLNEEAAARAVRFGAALPERTRAIVSAYRVFRVGDPLEAERLYRRILARYPNDMETIELLGETLFHNNPFFGRPTAEAREPLERALAMDPGNRELMVHLMDLAALEHRAGALDSLSSRYARTDPGDEVPTALHAYAAMRALLLGPLAGRERTLSDLEAAGPDAVFDALVRVAPQLRDPELSDRLAAMLTDATNDEEVRATGHLHRAWLAVARGRWRAAEGHWRSAESIQPDWTLVRRVLAATLPHSPASPDALDSLRRAVTEWAPGPALEDGLHDGDLGAVRSYLLGLLSWRSADDAALTRAVADLAVLPGAAAVVDSAVRTTRGTPGLGPALAETLDALRLWRAGQLTEAIAALDRAELRSPFHRRVRSPLLEQHLNRFVRAEVLRAQGALGGERAEAADRDALRWYASLEDGYFHWGAPFVGPALLGAAEIHERRGWTPDAISAYERFLLLWRDADPELHAWLELARARLDRIRGGPSHR